MTKKLLIFYIQLSQVHACLCQSIFQVPTQLLPVFVKKEVIFLGLLYILMFRLVYIICTPIECLLRNEEE